MAGGWAPKTLVAKNGADSIEPTETLDNWDPMKEDYNCPVFNSYRPMNTTDAIRRLSDLPKGVKSLARDSNKNSPSNTSSIQLYIRNIPHKLISKTQLKEIFETCGEVVHCKLITTNADLPYSFGFVTYSTEVEAVAALKRFNGKNLDPEKKLKPLIVAVASSSSSRAQNDDSPSDNFPRTPLKQRDSNAGSSSPLPSKCECCGKPEIKFRCDKCNTVGYCSGRCLAKDESVHESKCSSNNHNNSTLPKSTSTFSKMKSQSGDSINKPTQQKSPSPPSNPVPVVSTVPKVRESNCPDASMRKFVRIPQNEIVNLVVTHLENPTKFYCVINNSTVEERMHDFNDFLNTVKLESIVGPPKIGALVVAPFEGCLYRAVIISTSNDYTNPSNIVANVLFVDFGNKAQVQFSSLKTCFSDRFVNFQYQAIECSFKDRKQPQENNFTEGSSFTAKVLLIDGRTHVLSVDLEEAVDTTPTKPISGATVTNVSPEKSALKIHPHKVSNSTFNCGPTSTAAIVESAITPLAMVSASKSKNSPYSFNSVSLVVGNEYRFKATNMNGQNFYVNLTDNFSKSLLSSIEKHLNVTELKRFVGSDSENSDDNTATIKINTPCLYVSNSGVVGRGRILYSIQDGSYLVFNVDNGNKCVVAVENLYRTSELYSQVAEQSVLCSGDTKCRNAIKSLIKSNQDAVLRVVSVERTPVLKYIVNIVSTLPVADADNSSTALSNSFPSASTSLVAEDLINLTVDDPTTNSKPTTDLNLEVIEYPSDELNSTKLAPRHVPVGSQFEVLMSHFNDNGDFYVHLFESGCTSDLNAITLRMVNDFSSSGCSKRTPISFDKKRTIIPQGTPVVAYDNDDRMYYRCELVSDITETDNEFQVLSVDFGKKFTASPGKCYIADHTLCIYPKVAVHCSLDNNDGGVLPPDFNLQSLHENNNQAIFTFKFLQLLPDGKYVIQIHAVDA